MGSVDPRVPAAKKAGVRWNLLAASLAVPMPGDRSSSSAPAAAAPVSWKKGSFFESLFNGRRSSDHSVTPTLMRRPSYTVADRLSFRGEKGDRVLRALSDNSASGKGPLTFDSVLRAHAGVHYLLKFCAQEDKSSENLLLFLELRGYQKLPAGIHRELAARKIYNKFLSPSAPMLIAVAEDLLVGVKAALESAESPSSTIFDEVFAEVAYLLRYDIFPRFIASPQYFKLLNLTLDERMRFDIEQFDLHRLLGAGGFGMVLLVRRHSSRNYFACKVVDKRIIISQNQVHQIRPCTPVTPWRRVITLPLHTPVPRDSPHTRRRSPPCTSSLRVSSGARHISRERGARRSRASLHLRPPMLVPDRAPPLSCARLHRVRQHVQRSDGGRLHAAALRLLFGADCARARPHPLLPVALQRCALRAQPTCHWARTALACRRPQPLALLLPSRSSSRITCFLI
jgi:hypothetical protein